jgi:hypothetical protein
MKRNTRTILRTNWHLPNFIRHLRSVVLGSLKSRYPHPFTLVQSVLGGAMLADEGSELARNGDLKEVGSLSHES